MHQDFRPPYGPAYWRPLQWAKRFVLDASPPTYGRANVRINAETEQALLYVAARLAIAHPHGHVIDEHAQVVHDMLKTWNKQRVRAEQGDNYVTIDRHGTYYPHETKGPDMVVGDAIKMHLMMMDNTAKGNTQHVYAGRRNEAVTVGIWFSHDIITLEFPSLLSAVAALQPYPTLFEVWKDKLTAHDAYKASTATALKEMSA